MKKYDKYLGSKSAIGRGAQKITNFVGGKGVSDYFGGKGTKKDLVKGVANVGMTVGFGGAGLLRAASKKVLAKGTKGVIQKGMSDAKARRQLDAIWKERGVNPKKLR